MSIESYACLPNLRFELPPELIAQSPTDRRDRSRLLVYRRRERKLSHHYFHDLPDLLLHASAFSVTDLTLVKSAAPLRETPDRRLRRMPAPSPGRHIGKHLAMPAESPGGKTARTGKFFLPDEYEATVLESSPSGEYLVKFDLEKDDNPAESPNELGFSPAPFTQRPADDRDELRYQTVYANSENRTAVAAPTAGLHFTPEILDILEENGHSVHDLTLSVGLGTFRPIETERIEDHPMHAEEYSIGPKAKNALLANDRKTLAVGTTSVRTIEHYLSFPDSEPEKATVGQADLFIRPPYSFKGVDHLLTNFHLPGSTLLCLVSAFLSPGKEDGLSTLKEIYAQAVALEYRFFSYGDAMLIL